MQDYTYLSVILIILCASGWLDTVLSRLGMRKDLTLFTLFSCIALQNFVPEISGVEIVPSSMLLIAVLAVASYAKKEFAIGIYFGSTLVFGIFTLALLYLFPILSIDIITVISALILCLLFGKRPFLSMLICVSIPYFAYASTLFADFFYYFGDNLPTAHSVYTAQIAAVVISAVTAFARVSVPTTALKKEMK